MYCIGLTGNICTGKSQVANFFKLLGAKIINADDIAHVILKVDLRIINLIKAKFKLQYLDKKELRAIIFNDINAKLWLEKLMHPAIRFKILEQLKFYKNQLVIIEIPLLMSKSSFPYLNRVLVVSSSLELQLERLMLRDNCSKEAALLIINSQPTLAKKKSIADDVINNTGGIASLKRAVTELFIKYKQLFDELEEEA